MKSNNNNIIESSNNNDIDLKEDITLIYKNKFYLLDNNVILSDWIKYKLYILDINNYFITINSHHIININEKLSYYMKKYKIKRLYLCIDRKLYGGGLVDMFMGIIEIGKFFFILIDMVIWLIKFIIWVIFFIAFLIKFLMYDLIIDFKNSIIIIVITILRLPIDLITSLFAFGINGIGGWMTSIFGWDQTNLTYNDKQSNYFKHNDTNKKCYLTNNNTVPFSILIGTILCPPLGVFMDLGISGWFNIFICAILTVFYYIPGLCYALLIIYS